MFRWEKEKLVMDAGDYGAPVAFAVTGEELEEGDRLRFTLERRGRELLRREYPASELKAAGGFLLALTAEESEALTPGFYLWSVRLVRGGERIVMEDTVKGPCILEVR